MSEPGAGGLRFNTEVPLGHGCAEPRAITELVATLEVGGFSALGFTDHPAPPLPWLEQGGHPTYDPFAALAFCAATTTRIRLLTYLAVLPYRNPLLVAKSIATVDRLSGGRLTVTVGAGYLRSEFRALGRPFEERNDLMDEALEVLTTAFAEGGLTYAGRDFSARDQVIEPGPVQRPHPPIWIGGSSRRSRERVARYGAGWAPLLTGELLARATRSARMATLDDVAAAIVDLHGLLADAGRAPRSVAVQLDGVVDAPSALERPDEHHDLLARLRSIGVTDVLVRTPPGLPPAEVNDLYRRYAGAFIPER